MVETWLSGWSNEIQEARPQPLTVRNIREDANIYPDRLQAQAGRFLRDIYLLRKKAVCW